MQYKLYHRLTAGIVLVFTLIMYIVTMQPTFAFWDPGEFTSVSFILGIPHPPGVPFNIIIGRIFSLLPFFSDISQRIAFSSVISSAVAVLLVYLIAVKILISINGKPENKTDEIIIFSSSAIGAFALAFCGTFWFNAIETDSEAKAILFITLILWLMLVWKEKKNENGSDNILILCFFLVGIGVGAHLLVAQTILFVGLIYFLYRFEINIKSILIAVVIIIASFFLVFPGVIIYLPYLTDLNFAIPIAIITVLILLVILTNKKSSIAGFVSLSILFIILGYSIYTSVLIRASADNLPVNQNKPSTFHSLVFYLNRGQYGDEPKVWPRRWTSQPEQKATWENYSSDVDFLWRYQIRDMYMRYLGWQFIGREGYKKGDGIDLNKLYAIPFIIGLFGIYFNFRKDKKIFFILLTIFISFGLITALYQNQQDAQLRERDYFYVASYIVYALWINMGVFFISVKIKQKINSRLQIFTAPVLISIFFIIITLNMLFDSYKYQNRSGNYLPFDYGYNLLQSLEKDAILVTSGDNDTFPLWCLQSVYGIRTDVRIINLALANSAWYNLQLKNEKPYGALTVPYNYTDEQLSELQPIIWDENTPLMFSVPKNAYPDTMSNKPDTIFIKVPATIREKRGDITMMWLHNSALVLLDIIKANNWQRPIYFSTTVPDIYCVGLNNFLRLEGMAQRLVPYKTNLNMTLGVNQAVTEKCLMSNISETSREPAYGFLFRNVNNPKIFYDEEYENTIESYRKIFLKLAFALSEENANSNKVKVVLSKMNEIIPVDRFKTDYKFKRNLALLYYNIQDMQKSQQYASETEKDVTALLNSGRLNANEQIDATLALVDIYEMRGLGQQAINILNKMISKFPYEKSLITKRDKMLMRDGK